MYIHLYNIGITDYIFITKQTIYKKFDMFTLIALKPPSSSIVKIGVKTILPIKHGFYSFGQSHFYNSFTESVFCAKSKLLSKIQIEFSQPISNKVHNF